MVHNPLETKYHPSSSTNKGAIIRNLITRWFFLTAGSLIAALALKLLLVPNKIIDGGIVGISIMGAYLSGWPLGYFFIALNLPFVVLSYYYIGKTFVISTLYSIFCLSVAVELFKNLTPLSLDLILAAIFGGVLLGIGVGLVIRYQGSLDGTEIIAMILSPRFGFSVGEIIMFFNIFILGCAAFVFSLDRALYSLITYFVAFRTIDIVVEGINDAKAAMIISHKPDEIAQTVIYRLGRPITYLYGRGGFSNEERNILYCVVTRIELPKLKAIIHEIDPLAFVTVEEVHEVLGGYQCKQCIHPFLGWKNKEER